MVYNITFWEHVPWKTSLCVCVRLSVCMHLCVCVSVSGGSIQSAVIKCPLFQWPCWASNTTNERIFHFICHGCSTDTQTQTCVPASHSHKKHLQTHAHTDPTYHTITLMKESFGTSITAAPQVNKHTKTCNLFSDLCKLHCSATLLSQYLEFKFLRYSQALRIECTCVFAIALGMRGLFITVCLKQQAESEGRT